MRALGAQMDALEIADETDAVGRGRQRRERGAQPDCRFMLGQKSADGAVDNSKIGQMVDRDQRRQREQQQAEEFKTLVHVVHAPCVDFVVFALLRQQVDEQLALRTKAARD